MCKQASMILVFDRQTESISAHFHPMKDSHTEILKLIGIKEDRTEPEKCNFVRIEIVPPNGDILQPVDTWKYTVDEPDLNRLPDWYKQSESHCEYIVRNALPEYLKTRITVGDAIGADRAIMTGGNRATLTGGDESTLISKWYDRYIGKIRVAVAYVGENGIKPGVKYRVVNGVFEEVTE